MSLYILHSIPRVFPTWTMTTKQGNARNASQCHGGISGSERLSPPGALDGRLLARAACPADVNRQLDEVPHTKGPLQSWSSTITGGQDKAISLHYGDTVFSQITLSVVFSAASIGAAVSCIISLTKLESPLEGRESSFLPRRPLLTCPSTLTGTVSAGKGKISIAMETLSGLTGADSVTDSP